MLLNQQLNAKFDAIPDWFIALLIRVAAAVPFWISARTKVDGWQIWDVNTSAVFLFEHEYQVPILSPQIAATFAALGEHVFSVLLIIGLLARLGALGLLGMTLVIQVFVYPDAWTVHILWAGLLVYVIGRGPGAISLDRKLGLENS